MRNYIPKESLFSWGIKGECDSFSRWTIPPFGLAAPPMAARQPSGVADFSRLTLPNARASALSLRTNACVCVTHRERGLMIYTHGGGEGGEVFDLNNAYDADDASLLNRSLSVLDVSGKNCFFR